ncbi:GGDEF domain-containing protein [Stappia sp. WLB 29]|uniref:GGDEF domain-containing protein n=1 Tax=Stappia sp. WLB 29 TaxID=2925220 RepID=UPI0020BDB12E|nr:GGDEF domain-containing protein [Stappia sp. WLB 29]
MRPMPHLDFQTLYILIFLNSLAVTAVWAGFAWIYRPHTAAQYWLAGTLLSLVGGLVLATQGNAGALVPAVLGNTIVILGFSQFWIGLRRFEHRQGGWAVAVAFTLAAAAVMIALHDSGRGRAIVYASGQSAVMLACLVQLLRNRISGIGAVIAATAFAVALAGQLLVVGSNGAVLAGMLDYEVYYALASYALLCTVFSGIVWNLGFALMAVDSLHRQLKGLSETDALTGLANRRAFAARADLLQQQAEIRPWSLILIDLNDFKPLNDRFGHLAGDRALAHFAQVLLSCARPGDLVARLGGDEFALLLPGTSLAEAETLARAIRRKVASSPLPLGEGTVPISAAIGLAGSGEEPASGDRLFSLADARLYEDKKASKEQRPRSGPTRLQLATQG